MTASVAGRDPVEQLAEEFLARLRRGDRPPLSEYTNSHPELAEEIRDLFPALVMMEEAKPAGTEPHETTGGSAAAPEQLGDFRILREVARGGMGVVYEAEQMSLGRHVALKVLPSQSGADPLRLLRFRREARSAAKLHHTNIVPVFEVGSSEGVHYYAMQFIQGQGLDEVLHELRRLRAGDGAIESPKSDLTASLAGGLRSGLFPGAPIIPLPRPAVDVPRSDASALLTGPVSHYFRSVARLGLQAAEALAYAHGQRVLHRDVKPSNLLLDREGTLWLTDFGLAKDDSDDLTRTGDIVGTVRYMAPERFHAVSDPRTDVYSLGITLYEMLALRPAFPEADRFKLIQQIAKDDPPKPRSIDAAIPRDLETIVLKAIEKEPNRRYSSAADMAEDMRRFLADRPIRARRASWREQAWRWCRRNPGIAASLSTAVAFLVLLVVGLSIATVQVWGAKRNAETALAEEKQSAYFQRIALADRELAANNLARAEELLDLCPPELRRWEWHYLKRSRGRPPLLMRHTHQISARASLSSDGRRVATAGLNGSVTIWDTSTGRLVRVIPAHTNRCWTVTYSPDGKLLASTDESTNKSTPAGEIKFWDSETGALVRTVLLPQRFVNGIAFSPDGARLATSSYRLGASDETLEIRDVATGLVVVSLANHDASTQGLAFSPDGKLLASASGDDTVRVSDTRTGRIVWEFHDRRPGEHPSRSVAFSPDGLRVAAGYGTDTDQDPGGVRIFDSRDGRELKSLTGHSVHGLAFSADGRLATAGLDATVRLWDPDRAEQLLTLRGFTDAVRTVAFTPDGCRLVTVSEDRSVRVWDATPVIEDESLGDEVQTLAGHSNCVNGVSFHPSEPLLASVSTDGTVRFWDASAGFTPQRVISTALKQVHGLAFSPNGDRLALVGESTASCPVLETKSGKLVRQMETEPDSWHRRVVYSPDGMLLAGCNSDGVVTVWDAESGKSRRLEGHQPWLLAIAFGPDPRRPLLAVASTSGEVRVWNPVTGQQVTPTLTHLGASALKFSPDSRRLATAGWDNVIRIWDTATWKVVEQLRDPSGGPNGISFSPDGKLVAWGGTDSTVKVWRLGSEDFVTLRGHRNWVWDVAFSPRNGERIASASRDGTIRIWKTPTFGVP